MSKKAVVVYSGGMDSFTLLNRVHQQGLEAYALSFDYGQRHVKELEVAARVCNNLGIAHKVVDISAINSLCIATIRIPCLRQLEFPCWRRTLAA